MHSVSSLSFLGSIAFSRVFNPVLKLNCTKSALLNVFNVILLATYSGDCHIIALLGLMGAFDTVDHIILLSCLKQRVGINGTALEWFGYNLEKHTVPC